MSRSLPQWIAIKRQRKALDRSLRRLEALARAWVERQISEARMATLVRPRAVVVSPPTSSEPLTLDSLREIRQAFEERFPPPPIPAGARLIRSTSLTGREADALDSLGIPGHASGYVPEDLAAVVLTESPTVANPMGGKMVVIRRTGNA